MRLTTTNSFLTTTGYSWPNKRDSESNSIYIYSTGVHGYIVFLKIYFVMCTLLFNDYNSIASWTKLLLFSVVPVVQNVKCYTIKIRALPGLPVQRWELTPDGLCARVQYSCTVYLSLFFHLLLILLPPPSCSSMPPHLLPAAPTWGISCASCSWLD